MYISNNTVITKKSNRYNKARPKYICCPQETRLKYHDKDKLKRLKTIKPCKHNSKLCLLY